MSTLRDQDVDMGRQEVVMMETAVGSLDVKRVPMPMSLRPAGAPEPHGDMAAPAQLFLQETKLKDVVRHQQVVTLEHDMSIGNVLRKLAKHKILSAPLIVDVGLEDTETNGPIQGGPSLLGWVDVNDLVRDFLHYLREHKQPKQQLPGSMLALMKLLEADGPNWTDRPVVTLVDSRDMELVYQHEAGTPLLTAIKDIFLAPKQPPSSPGGAEQQRQHVVHRVAVFDSYGTVTHVISQMDIVRFLAQHSDRLGPLADASLEQLGLMGGDNSKVFTVDAHTPTLLAFDAMQKAGVRGAAVLSDTEDLVANISASDLRGVEPEHLGMLALPVAEFLALLHGTSYLGYSQSTSEASRHPFFAGPDNVRSAEDARIYAPITATPATTFRELLSLMAMHVVHRVYVLDDTAPGRKVRAVVTTTDCLRVAATASS